MIFIIPVKSAQISPSWEKFSKIFERTLKSVCQQTDQDFKVVVVCNEKPLTKFSHPNVYYHSVDFPPPTPEATKDFTGLHSPKEADKAKKIIAGLDYAKQFNSSHTMVVDADDCINRNIVSFIKKNSTTDGWYSKSGYVYKEGSKLIFKKTDKFNSLCGTSLIVKSEFVKGLITPDLFYQHAHRTLENGVKMSPLPFPAAVYTINGENYFMTEKAVEHFKGDTVKNGFSKLIQRVMRYRIGLLTSGLKNKYGLYSVVT